MPKGKKFDAAQKHFIERENKFNRQVAALRRENETLRETAKQLKEELEQSQFDNAQMHDWIERLLEYTELSKDDIKRACKKDAEMAGFLSTLKLFTKYL